MSQQTGVKNKILCVSVRTVVIIKKGWLLLFSFSSPHRYLSGSPGQAPGHHWGSGLCVLSRHSHLILVPTLPWAG